MKSLATVLFIILFVSFHAFAQNPADSAAQSEALKYLYVQPEVKVTVQQTDQVITSPLCISVHITNLTDSNMSLVKAQVDFPEMLIGREIDNPVDLVFANTKDLDSGNTMIGKAQFPPAISHWYFPFQNLRLLFFKPAEYEARVIIAYKVFDRNETMIEEKVMVKLEPPVNSILWGSILGSVLLALYIALYKRTKEMLSWKITLSRFVSVSLTGIVSGIIIIFLLFRFKNLDLPVTIAVTDFFGGLVLGLFTYKLGDWLYSKLADSNTPFPVQPTDKGNVPKKDEKAE
jgi:hypothetical protein